MNAISGRTLSLRSKRVFRFAIVVVASAGCGAPAADSEKDVASRSSALDPYGAIPVAWAGNLHTSETSVLVNNWGGSGNNVTTMVSYDTDAEFMQNSSLLSYSQTNRTICAGAQLFGYSAQSGAPSTTTYSQMSPSTISPPQPSAAWPVWMGRTSLGQFPASPFIYLATLAIPDFNMPKNGGCLTGDVSNLVGGACILRSFNPGPPGTIPVFTQSDDDCLHNDYYDPYDGTGGIL